MSPRGRKARSQGIADMVVGRECGRQSAGPVNRRASVYVPALEGLPGDEEGKGSDGEDYGH